MLRLPQPLVKYYETDGISSNIANIAHARKMLLTMHGALLREHKWFVAAELKALSGRA